MPTYNLSAQITVSAYTTVEALDETTPREIAAQRNAVIGGLNTGEDETESWIVDEVDGTVENIRVEYGPED